MLEPRLAAWVLMLSSMLAAAARGQTPPTELAPPTDAPPPATEAAPPPTPAQPATSAGPSTVYVGVYLRRIDQLDLKAGSAKITYYVWARWRGEVDGSRLEVVNGTLESKDSEYLREQDGWKYAYHRCTATVLLEVDYRDFPFDKHHLALELEHAEAATDEVVLAVDTEGMKHLTSPESSGWLVGEPRYDVLTTTYRTNWGMIDIDPDDSTQFSRFRARMRLTHAAGATFTKTFLPLFIAMLITFLAFVIHPEELEARVGIGVAGTFGVVTSQAVVAESLPEISYMTLSDQIHTSSLFFVFATLLATCYAGHLARKELVDRAKRLDRVVGGAMTAGYFTLVVALIQRA